MCNTYYLLVFTTNSTYFRTKIGVDTTQNKTSNVGRGDVGGKNKDDVSSHIVLNVSHSESMIINIIFSSIADCGYRHGGLTGVETLPAKHLDSKPPSSNHAWISEII